MSHTARAASSLLMVEDARSRTGALPCPSVPRGSAGVLPYLIGVLLVTLRVLPYPLGSGIA